MGGGETVRGGYICVSLSPSGGSKKYPLVFHEPCNMPQIPRVLFYLQQWMTGRWRIRGLSLQSAWNSKQLQHTANRSWTAPECLGFVTECFAFLISGRFIAGLVISTLLCPWAAYHVPVQMQTQKSRAMMAQKCCLGSPSPRQGVFNTTHHSAAVAALPCCVQWFSGVRRGLGDIKHLIPITTKWGGFSKYNKGWY